MRAGCTPVSLPKRTVRPWARTGGNRNQEKYVGFVVAAGVYGVLRRKGQPTSA